MTGKDFVARQRLSDRFDATLADVGQTCERVPAESLPWLIEQQLIEPAAPARLVPRPRRVADQEE